MSSSPSILVVDGLSETAEVLRAVFEPRGHVVNRVRQSHLHRNESPRPRVVVWHANDAENDPISDRLSEVPRIVIGRSTCSMPGHDTPRLSQPFEYGELLRRIECLLASDAR